MATHFNKDVAFPPLSRYDEAIKCYLMSSNRLTGLILEFFATTLLLLIIIKFVSPTVASNLFFLPATLCYVYVQVSFIPFPFTSLKHH